MTLTRFVTKNAFRNKRRSILTVLSIGGSLLLLTFLITIWRSFYDSKPSEQSAQRLIVCHKVSLVFNLPSYYRQKIQSIPGVKEDTTELLLNLKDLHVKVFRNGSESRTEPRMIRMPRAIASTMRAAPRPRAFDSAVWKVSSASIPMTSAAS